MANIVNTLARLVLAIVMYIGQNLLPFRIEPDDKHILRQKYALLPPHRFMYSVPLEFFSNLALDRKGRLCYFMGSPQRSTPP